MKKLVFSTDQLPEHLGDRDRFSLWRDIYTDQVCAADFSHFAEGPFTARSEFLQFGEICVTQSEYALETFARDRTHIAKDSRDDCLIGVYLNDSRSRLVQRGRELELGKGKPYIALSGEPVTNTFDSPSALRGMVVPRKVLAERVAGFSGEPALIDHSPAWQHLNHYLSMLLHSQVVVDSALGKRIEDFLVDLLALALGASGDSAELATTRGLRAVRLQEVLREIRNGFARHDFSPATIARTLGLSPRYIQDLLQESGTTFTERVLELRLQTARTMLMDRASDRLRISEIAFSAGFGDVSYFNQAFRRRFGCTPTQARRGKSAARNAD